MSKYIASYMEENKDSLSLKSLFYYVCEMAPDIREHCPTLCNLAAKCDHVTEFGTRWGASTIAFLYGQPEKLVCYDWHKKETVDTLAELSGDTEFEFHKCSTLEIEIEETDLLFIDTLHTYSQLKQELALHSPKSKKYIVMHDTVSFGIKGQRGEDGLGRAIDEFLEENKEWKVFKHYSNNNGLTILERKNDD